MAIHHELAALAERTGAGLFDLPEAFRAALDDFVPEESATVGERSLLEDAIRHGAFSRFTEQVGHGAAIAAAIDVHGEQLAHRRGTRETGGARWALSALGFAIGLVDESEVLRRHGAMTTAGHADEREASPVRTNESATDIPVQRHAAPPPAPPTRAAPTLPAVDIPEPSMASDSTETATSDRHSRASIGNPDPENPSNAPTLSANQAPTPSSSTKAIQRRRRSRWTTHVIPAVFVLVMSGSIGASLLLGDGESQVVTTAELDAVKIEDPGGRPSDDWADGVRNWLDSGDDNQCRLGSVHEFSKGPRAEEFGSSFTVLYVNPAEDGEPPRAACDVSVRGDEDQRAFLVTAELFPDADAALAEWDASVGGDNDEDETLSTWRRSDPHPFLSGTIWISCWNDFDRAEEDHNCDANWFYGGVVLKGTLSSSLDPDPTPQDAADWFAAALPGLVGADSPLG